MKNVVLGITGSIAAYKAADIAHMFVKKGVNVDVIMTPSAKEFITPLTLRSLTGNRVYGDMFDDNFPNDIAHISLAKKADAILIAPATANIIGKIAGGTADSLLASTVMAAYGKTVFIAPAMNTNMWNNPIVQSNIDKLKEYGYKFIEPKTSLLACGTYGKGALADPEQIVKEVLSYLEK